MKSFQITAATLLLAAPLAFLAGCGGGSGGSGGGTNTNPTATPTVAATATAGGRVLVVSLRDSAGQPVDGIVTVGTTVIATSGGTATFNRNVAAGVTAVSAEVDGATTSGTVTVRTSGSTVFSLLIAPSVTPVPSGTVPPPPFPA